MVFVLDAKYEFKIVPGTVTLRSNIRTVPFGRSLRFGIECLFSLLTLPLCICFRTGHGGALFELKGFRTGTVINPKIYSAQGLSPYYQ